MVINGFLWRKHRQSRPRTELVSKLRGLRERKSSRDRQTETRRQYAPDGLIRSTGFLMERRPSESMQYTTISTWTQQTVDRTNVFMTPGLPVSPTIPAENVQAAPTMAPAPDFPKPVTPLWPRDDYPLFGVGVYHAAAFAVLSENVDATAEDAERVKRHYESLLQNAIAMDAHWARIANPISRLAALTALEGAGAQSDGSPQSVPSAGANWGGNGGLAQASSSTMRYTRQPLEGAGAQSDGWPQSVPNAGANWGGNGLRQKQYRTDQAASAHDVHEVGPVTTHHSPSTMPTADPPVGDHAGPTGFQGGDTHGLPWPPAVDAETALHSIRDFLESDL